MRAIQSADDSLDFASGIDIHDAFDLYMAEKALEYFEKHGAK